MAILGGLRGISSEIHCLWCHLELTDPLHSPQRCATESAEADAEFEAALAEHVATMTPEERAEWERSP